MIIQGRKVRTLPFALGCATIAGLSALAFSVLPASAVTGPTTAAQEAHVKDAFTQALIVDRTLGAPQASVVPSAAGAPSSTPSAASAGAKHALRPLSDEKTDPNAAIANGIPDKTETDGRIARDKKNIDKHFGSADLVARENKTIERALAAVADPNFRFLGAGVSQVTITSATVSGTTATVEASATVWSKFAAKIGPGGSWATYSPSAVKNYTTTLSIGPAGTWLVMAQKETYAPGSMP